MPSDHEHFRILVADDNPVNQKVARLMLERAGFAVDVVGDGRQAVAAHRAHPYKLIFMDCEMPLLDGFNATQEIRALGSSVVIIALTAHTLSDIRSKCWKAGMNDCIAKPFQAGQLADLVRTYQESAQPVSAYRRSPLFITNRE